MSGSSRRKKTFHYGIRRSLNWISARRTRRRELFDWVESCVDALVLILLAFVFLVRTATVSGSSMVTTLHDRERLLLWQAGYHDPQYGDIVVVDRTGTGETPVIKRVIGRAGDRIDIDFSAGEVRRNGELLDEPYIYEPTHAFRDVDFPAVVPDGTVFVLGDNRNHSLDSRDSSIGMVDLRQIMGKAVFRLYPFEAAGCIG